MTTRKIEILYDVFEADINLTAEDRSLLLKAREATKHSYSPYSQFRVGAAARLSGGAIVTGSNQENASFPVGLCAERILLSSVIAQFPETAIETIAISYNNAKGKSDHPVSPCGICRQALSEFEIRTKKPIRLILGGMVGEILVFNTVTHLLPLAFSGIELR